MKNEQVLGLQNEIERLDREWALQREKFLASQGEGIGSTAPRGGSMFSGALMMCAGAVCSVISLKFHAPILLAFGGLLLVAFGLFTIIYGMVKASPYYSAEAVYRSRRRTLLRDLKNAHRQPAP